VLSDWTFKERFPLLVLTFDSIKSSKKLKARNTELNTPIIDIIGIIIFKVRRWYLGGYAFFNLVLNEGSNAFTLS
jgi:hypothetical protein